MAVWKGPYPLFFSTWQALQSRESGFSMPMLVAADALLVVSTHQPGSEGVGPLDRFAVAAAAGRRFFRGRTVVVAALAQGPRFAVKIAGQLAVPGFVDQRVDDFAVGEYRRLESIRQLADGHLLGDFVGRVGFCLQVRACSRSWATSAVSWALAGFT
jgi:hypothetical protein